MMVNVTVQPRVLTGAIYELVPPQVWETEVPTHGKAALQVAVL